MTNTAASKPKASVRRRLDATLLALAASQGRGDGATWAECIACGNAAIIGLAPRAPRAWQRGHLTSADNGGSHSVWNLAPMCRRCNHKVGTRNVAECFTPRYNVHAGYNGVMLPDPGPYDDSVDTDEWLSI